MTPDPEYLDIGPNRPPRRPATIALVTVSTTVVLLAVWAVNSRPEPIPPDPLVNAPTIAIAKIQPLDAGPIFIQTTVPTPQDTENNHYFDLYRDRRLLDAGTYVFEPGWAFSFQGSRGTFAIIGHHLVLHGPLRYLDWTLEGGTRGYAGLTGSGTAEFLYPEPHLNGILGRLSGQLQTAPAPRVHYILATPMGPGRKQFRIR